MDAREYILNKGFTIAPIDTPWWPELDGTLAVRAMSAGESLTLDANSRDKVTIGKTLVSILVYADSKKPVFQPTDFEFLMDTVDVASLTPILEKATELNKKKSVMPLQNSNPVPESALSLNSH